MITFDQSPQGSVEWLAIRRGCITGSRFRDALDLLKGGTPSKACRSYAMDVARERVGGTVAPTFVNAAMRTGTTEEPRARLAYEELTGNVVLEAGFAYTADRLFGASVDDRRVNVHCLIGHSRQEGQIAQAIQVARDAARLVIHPVERRLVEQRPVGTDMSEELFDVLLRLFALECRQVDAQVGDFAEHRAQPGGAFAIDPENQRQPRMTSCRELLQSLDDAHAIRMGPIEVIENQDEGEAGVTVGEHVIVQPAPEAVLRIVDPGRKSQHGEDFPQHFATVGSAQVHQGDFGAGSKRFAAKEFQQQRFAHPR